MSRTLLVLALVALFFAGVVAQSSSSSTADISSSVEASTGGSSSATPSSSAQSSSAAPSSSSSSVQGSTGSGSSSSSTGPTGNTTTSSSTGPVVASSTGVIVQNVSFALQLQFDNANFTQAVQDSLAATIAKTLQFSSYSKATWVINSNANTGRRLLAVQYNTLTLDGVNSNQAAAAKTTLSTPAGVTSVLSTVSTSFPNLAINTAYAGVDGAKNPTPNSAAALAASPLVLAALAAFAMLF